MFTGGRDHVRCWGMPSQLPPAFRLSTDFVHSCGCATIVAAFSGTGLFVEHRDAPVCEPAPWCSAAPE